MKSITLPTKKLCLLSALVAAALVGCDSSSSNAAPQPLAMQGLWDRSGYGELYQIDANGGQVYEYTRSTCLISESADNQDLAEFFSGATLAPDEQSLTLGEDDGLFPQTLTKLSALPAPCENQALVTQPTATATFEHFVQNYSDYYAFFEQRGVDWQSEVAAARDQVSEAMSDEDLFELMASLLSPLDDGHVQLSGNGEVYRPASTVGANKVIEESFAEQSDFSDIQLYANAVSQQYWENLGDYLDEGSVRAFDGALPDRLIWGTLDNGTIGYLYIASMAFLSDSEDGLDQHANAELMDTVMADVINDLSSTQAMIIDLRSNFGGHDAVSEVVAGYFTDQQSFFGSRHARSYLGDSARVEAFVEPRSTTPYLNPVALITGEETASAAESFTLAMRARPLVTQVGENTNGILSDVLIKQLPNGWEFWLANEVYYDHLDAVHEVTGIAPDIEAPVFSLSAIAAGNNAALDAAIDALGF